MTYKNGNQYTVVPSLEIQLRRAALSTENRKEGTAERGKWAGAGSQLADRPLTPSLFCQEGAV